MIPVAESTATSFSRPSSTHHTVSSATSNAASSPGISSGAKAGIALGVVIVILVILGGFVVFTYRRRRQTHVVEAVKLTNVRKALPLLEVDGSSVRAEAPGTKLEMTTELDTKWRADSRRKDGFAELE